MPLIRGRGCALYTMVATFVIRESLTAAVAASGTQDRSQQANASLCWTEYEDGKNADSPYAHNTCKSDYN